MFITYSIISIIVQYSNSRKSFSGNMNARWIRFYYDILRIKDLYTNKVDCAEQKKKI